MKEHGMNQSVPSDTRHFYIDEAGDSVLFGKRGKVLVGTEGCSKFFILGALQVIDPASLSRELSALHGRIVNDPYFKDIPSLQPKQQKTALFFHAKDDLPEIRRDVFSLLQQHEMKFFAVIRDKRTLAEYVRFMDTLDYHYRPDSVYDDMVSLLFKGMLHKGDEYQLVFAGRGKKDRTCALTNALAAARKRFYHKWGIESTAPTKVEVSTPIKTTCLQAADYFLWALQRLYERGEDRYWNFLCPKVSLVIDQDDTRDKRYGVYYTKEKPLTQAAWKAREGI